jgi:class 3 adenylate cyclase
MTGRATGGCRFTRRERAAVEAELAKAVADQAEVERACDQALAALPVFGAREIKTLGDGFLATFDGPARAVRCASAIIEQVRSLGIDVRSGLHTGEIEIQQGDVLGIAVNVAARIAALAESREVLDSSTVRDGELC